MMFTKRIIKITAILTLLCSTTFASNHVTCADYAQNAIDREGITWDDVVNTTAAAVGGVGGSLLTASLLLAATPMEKATPGVKVAIYSGIALGGSIGAATMGGISYLITSNIVDVINLSDEVELGGAGFTIDTLINTILKDLPREKLIQISNQNSREIIREKISEVIKTQPEICSSVNSKEVLRNISREVQRSL